MQATLDARALKPFTRVLTCVAKYGDEMLIHSKSDAFVITAINQAKSAFCSFTFSRAFFQKYTVLQPSTQSRTAGPSRSHMRSNSDEEVLRCQLQTKALLAVLRHKNNERSVERCEISIVEGSEISASEAREDEDSFESRLVVRLHCKHGITKTHRLLLNTPTSSEAPIMQESEYDSHITVQPQAIKDIFEHFPNAKGPKSDPEVLWRFDADEVSVRSLERGMDAKGKSQLASEMFVPADDFDAYEVFFSPMTIGFFLREFNAITTLLQTLSLPLSMRFNLPAEPLYITADSEDASMQILCVIATNVTRAEDDDPAIKELRAGTYKSGAGSARKRALDGDANGHVGSGRGKAMRRVDSVHRIQSRVSGSDSGSATRQPTASTSAQGLAPVKGRGLDNSPAMDQDLAISQSQDDDEPLFLPSQSQRQLSAADVYSLSQSGLALGMGSMTADEFAAMLDDEGEEVEIKANHSPKPPSGATSGSARLSTKSSLNTSTAGADLEYDELDDDEMLTDLGLGPTQSGSSVAHDKTFRPLFKD